MIVGTQGTGVGSTIKGHAHQGGKQMRRCHRRYTAVTMIDEDLCYWLRLCGASDGEKNCQRDMEDSAGERRITLFKW